MNSLAHFIQLLQKNQNQQINKNVLVQQIKPSSTSITALKCSWSVSWHDPDNKPPMATLQLMSMMCYNSDTISSSYHCTTRGGTIPILHPMIIA